MQPILTTKLSPPVTRSATVSRPALASLLAADLKPLTLLTAPAGFGKTTLAAAKYAELRARDQPAAWISLDIDDRDPFRFFTLLVEATRQALPGIGQYVARILETTPDLLLEQVVTHYLNDLAAGHVTFTLFLDDYHLAESTRNNEAVDLLLRHGRGHFALVLASRIVPALSLAALRVADCLIEINQDDLKFSVEETAEFVTRLHGVPLVRDDIRTLQARTEGWAAGLQLATLSLKRRADHSAFVRKFTGSVRDIADYLFSDVLCHQDGATREFLFRTSLLERMSAPLCNALTGRTDGQQTLERLEASNLFVVPMDDTRHWYRYHHLFRDYLQARMTGADESLSRELLLRASRHCAEHGQPAEAVTYALATGDHDRAASLVVDCSILMIHRGHMPQLVAWLKCIPDALVARYPRLLAIRCWMYFHVGKARQCEGALHAAEMACVAAVTDGPDSAAIRMAELKTLRIALIIAGDHCEDVCAAAEPLLAELGDQYPFLAGTAGNIISAAYLATWQVDRLRLVSARARALLAAADCPYGVMYTHVFSALADVAQGRLGDARRAVDIGLDVAVQECGDDSFPAAVARCASALVEYEAGHLDRARQLLEENLPLIRECGVMEVQRRAGSCLARIYGRQGEYDAARRVLEGLADCNHDDGERATLAVLTHERIRLLEREPGGARRGLDVLRAAGFLDLGSPPTEGWDRVGDEARLARARVELLLDRSEAALEILLSLWTRLETIDFLSKLQETALLIARAHMARGAVELARATLHSMWGETGELFYSPRWLEETERVRLILGKLAVPAEAPARGIDAGSLTGRELAVLELLASGRQTRRIAGDLGISEHTVKWHVKNILEKFGVPNRLSAVAHARNAGLIR